MTSNADTRSRPTFNWRLWQPPIYDDDARTRQARLIHGLTLGMLAVATAALLLAVRVAPELTVFTVLALLRADATFVVILLVNRMGRQRLAAWLLVVGPLLLITFTALSAGGVRSPGVQFFFVLSMISALVVGPRAGVLAGLACVVITFGLALAETLGVLPPPVVHYSVWMLWLLNAMYVAYFVLGLRMSMRPLAEALGEAQQLAGELNRHRQHLEDLVAQRTDELRKARDTADEANRAKSQFLADMSHEIRTPMNAVLGFAQLLLRDGNLATDHRRHLETINRAGDHLMSLIDGLLRLAKLEAGRDVALATAFELRGFIDDVAALFRPRALDSGLELTVEHDAALPRYIRADEGKLRQVLSNLIGNAIKFTSRGRIAVRVRAAGATTAAEARLVIEVEDTGSGIAADELARLFRKFEQAQAGRVSEGGTGLGLAISRALVQLMGGEIAADSQAGKGSVFRFDILYVAASADEVARKHAARATIRLAADQPARRILVADDLEDNRALLTGLLAAAGFDARDCVDGAQAVREFQAWAPHLIVIDYRMPALDGPAAIRQIRALPGGDAVKIICVTASAFDEHRQAALDAGADRFLSKPVRDGVLFEQIGELLRVRYEDGEAEPPVAPRSEPTSAEVARLPAALRDRLRQATVSADLTAMLSLIEEASRHDAELSAALRDLAERFEYRRITSLLDEPARASARPA